MKTSLSVALLSLALATGCVSTGKYDAAVADANAARADRARKAKDAEAALARKDAELSALRHTMGAAEASCARALGELEESKAGVMACSKALDEATAMNQQLRGELTRQGKDVDQLLSAKGALASSLDQARARLEELRRAQTAAELRAALFRDIAVRLKRMIDSGALAIVLRSGRMVLALPTDVLFDSGQAKIKPAGRDTLALLAAVLGTFEGRKFQVAGHTDDEPIRLSGFESNWDLSSARALEVVQLLIERGMKPTALSAAGYGEFDPVAPNDAPTNKAKNRRIEITLQPNIDDLVAVPEDGASGR